MAFIFESTGFWTYVLAFLAFIVALVVLFFLFLLLGRVKFLLPFLEIAAGIGAIIISLSFQKAIYSDYAGQEMSFFDGPGIFDSLVYFMIPGLLMVIMWFCHIGPAAFLEKTISADKFVVTDVEFRTHIFSPDEMIVTLEHAEVGGFLSSVLVSFVPSFLWMRYICLPCHPLMFCAAPAFFIAEGLVTIISSLPVPYLLGSIGTAIKYVTFIALVTTSSIFTAQTGPYDMSILMGSAEMNAILAIKAEDQSFTVHLIDYENGNDFHYGYDREHDIGFAFVPYLENASFFEESDCIDTYLISPSEASEGKYDRYKVNEFGYYEFDETVSPVSSLPFHMESDEYNENILSYLNIDATRYVECTRKEVTTVGGLNLIQLTYEAKVDGDSINAVYQYDLENGSIISIDYRSHQFRVVYQHMDQSLTKRTKEKDFHAVILKKQLDDAFGIAEFAFDVEDYDFLFKKETGEDSYWLAFANDENKGSDSTATGALYYDETSYEAAVSSNDFITNRPDALVLSGKIEVEEDNDYGANPGTYYSKVYDYDEDSQEYRSIRKPSSTSYGIDMRDLQALYYVGQSDDLFRLYSSSLKVVSWEIGENYLTANLTESIYDQVWTIQQTICFTEVDGINQVSKVTGTVDETAVLSYHYEFEMNLRTDWLNIDRSNYSIAA